MGDFEPSALTLLILSLILPGAVCNSENNCTEERLKLCKDQFDENSVPVCPEILELGNCLQPFANCVTWSSLLAKLNFQSLLKKLTSYPDCIRTKSGSKKECSKDSVSNCYQQFNQNATPICPEVKKLRQCISELSGCHAMKHPLYVLSREILDKHRDCFYVNYSRILEVLKKKDNSAQSKEGKQVRSSPSESTPLAGSSTASGREEKGEQDTHSSRLPYTFVVVATVFTCLFLVVLVVFSIVRHTTSSKRQRNVTVERAPVRIRIHSPNSRPRTRRHRHCRNNRRHVVVQGAQQTVSGFFEGNVPPPPYSAALDDTESIRAGDPPPPYRPPSCVAIGVIV